MAKSFKHDDRFVDQEFLGLSADVEHLSELVVAGTAHTAVAGGPQGPRKKRPRYFTVGVSEVEGPDPIKP